MIDEVIIIGIIILVIIAMGFLIWFFAIRDEGGKIGDSCGEIFHCKRGLNCLNAKCA